MVFNRTVGHKGAGVLNKFVYHQVVLQEMEYIAFTCVLAFATGCLGISIWHELRWRHRLVTWKPTKGRIVGIAQSKEVSALFGGTAVDHDGPWPEIEFDHRGKTVRFVSQYGGTGIPRVGAKVDLIVDQNTAEAEWISFTNRWLGTVVPVLFSSLFYWLAFNTTWGASEQIEKKQNKAEMATPRKPSD